MRHKRSFEALGKRGESLRNGNVDLSETINSNEYFHFMDKKAFEALGKRESLHQFISNQNLHEKRAFEALGKRNTAKSNQINKKYTFIHNSDYILPALKRILEENE